MNDTLQIAGARDVPSLIATLNRQHRIIAERLDRLEGVSSRTPTFSTSPDFGGNRLTNIGRSRKDTDAISRGELRDYLGDLDGETIVVDREIIFKRGARVGKSTRTKDDIITQSEVVQQITILLSSAAGTATPAPVGDAGVVGTSALFAREDHVHATGGTAGGDLTGSYPNPTLADADLRALRDLATTGIITRTGAGTVATRSVAVSGSGLAVANGDGVSGNPTISFSTQSANTVLAGPTSGGAATPAFRALVAADIDELIATTDLTDVAATTGTGTTIVFSTSPTFTTSITTPIVYGSGSSPGGLTIRANSADAAGTVSVYNSLALQSGLTSISGTTENFFTANQNITLAAASSEFRIFAMTGTVTNQNITNAQLFGFRLTPTLTNSGTTTIPAMAGLVLSPTVTAAVASSVWLGSFYPAFLYQPTIGTNGGSFAATSPGMTAYSTGGTVNNGVTVYERFGLVHNAMTLNGGSTVTSDTGLKVSTLAATTAIGVDIDTFTGTNLTSLRSVGTAVDMRHAGQAKFGATGAPYTTQGNVMELERTLAITGAVSDGQAAGLTIDPGYSGAFTVTRHNYLRLEDVSVSSSTVTDAAVIWFDAAVGTHKCLASPGAVAVTLGTGPTGATAGNPVGWMKINVNGTIRYIPFW